MNRKTLVFLAVGIVVIATIFFIYPGGKGSLQVEGPGVELVLRCGFWTNNIVRSSDKPTLLPSGFHYPVRLTMSKKADQDTWQVSSLGPWGRLSQIRVLANQTQGLLLGPPFTVKAAVLRNGPDVSISPMIVGQAGEVYGPAVSREGKMMPPPGFKIVDESGVVLAEGKFAFG